MYLEAWTDITQYLRHTSSANESNELYGAPCQASFAPGKFLFVPVAVVVICFSCYLLSSFLCLLVCYCPVCECKFPGAKACLLGASHEGLDINRLRRGLLARALPPKPEKPHLTTLYPKHETQLRATVSMTCQVWKDVNTCIAALRCVHVTVTAWYRRLVPCPEESTTGRLPSVTLRR